MNIKSFNAQIRGKDGSPLVVHRFAAKARKEIEDKQQKKKDRSQQKPAREPHAEFLEARYLRPDCKTECIPVTAVKNAIIGGARQTDLKMVHVRQAVFVCPVDEPSSDLVPILGINGKPIKGEMRTDEVTIGIDTKDIRYRPCYTGWRLDFTCQYNAASISEEQLRELIRNAGFGVGICEGRPEKSSLGWGRFELVE